MVAQLTALAFLDKVHGLGVLISNANNERFPAVYSKSEVVNIDFDQTGALIFFLMNGTVDRVTIEHPQIANAYQVTETYKLKIYLYSQKNEDPNCASQSQAMAANISRLLTGKKQAFTDATGVDFMMIETTSTNLDKHQVWKELFTAPDSLADTDLLLSIAINVTIEGNEQCFEQFPCGLVEVIASEDGVAIQTSDNSLIIATEA